MNQHSRSVFTLLTRAGRSFVSLFSTALLVCLLPSATQVKAQQPTWSATGSLGASRFLHTATLLANGNGLVAGGSVLGPNNLGQNTGSAELYDPATGNWTATAELNVPRGNHVATRLANGKVLVVGGHPGLTSAELFDSGTEPSTGNVTTQPRSGRMNLGRSFKAGNADDIKPWRRVATVESDRRCDSIVALATR